VTVILKNKETKMTAVLNGQRRPNLSDQINRLDKILDGLADGLNESVASAVQVAVKEAIEVVIRKLFTSTAMMPALASAMVPPAPKQPILKRIGNGFLRFWEKSLAVVKATPSALRRATGAIGRGIYRAANAIRRSMISRVVRAVATTAGYSSSLGGFDISSQSQSP
jgi:hypothetical protein